MNERVFAGTTSRAATARRRVLLALGGAGLVAVAQPSLSTAAGKAKKRCSKDKKRCRQVVENKCVDQNCVDMLLPCCATCNVGTGVVCVLDQF
jgi:hypothetical protein